MSHISYSYFDLTRSSVSLGVLIFFFFIFCISSLSVNGQQRPSMTSIASPSSANILSYADAAAAASKRGNISGRRQGGESTRTNGGRSGTIPDIPKLSAAYKEPEVLPFEVSNGTTTPKVSNVWSAWLQRIQLMNRPENRAKIQETFSRLFRQYFLTNSTDKANADKMNPDKSNADNKETSSKQQQVSKDLITDASRRRQQSAPQLDAGPINPFGIGGFGGEQGGIPGLGGGGGGLDFFMRVISFKRQLFSQLIQNGAFQNNGLLRRGVNQDASFGNNRRYPSDGQLFASGPSSANGQFNPVGGRNVQFNDPLIRRSSSANDRRYRSRQTTETPHEVEGR